MNLISKSLTRLECSPFFNPIIPTGKRITSHQIRFASVTGKTSSGGGRKKRTTKSPTKAPEAVITPAKSPEEESELVRPNEIAYENESSNWVNLIGFVDQPVQFDASEDGKFWAGTVVSQRLSISDSSAFWIPVIFEGDLAKVAARFVKKDDRIRVSGKLFIDSPPQNVTYPQSNVQVLVQKLDFVQPETESKAISSEEKEESVIKKRPAKVKKDVVTDEAFESLDQHTENSKQSQPDSLSMGISSSEKEESGIKKRPARVKKNIVANEAFESWDHLIDHPKQGQPDSSSMVVSQSGKEDSSIKKRPARAQDIVTDETSDSWNRLIENPKQWWDHRENKVNGLVKPRHPDFKSKDRSLSLWLNKAPSWVLPKLEGLEFDVLVPKARAVKQLKGEESWKELVQNPDKWWDNRVDKRNAKAPDFKHKETGEALWLNESPTWVLPNLPPVKKKQESFVSVV